ncbi:hypothetical protein LY90DRAFT_504063 [Neocallimastix californiae]|uniref:Uncharacterized protein n=1 Tax=Neocallimastix californiae TaxID=1754190 RepID=A0A1Y2EGM5_9FUNG|nr:hypothetical protein LY90DRAFT_504063 [Neocallimastix californiae]|eukprot:ORY70730.1 hypothetical protein LY90DRAFT_504063 [Neocallimastix californiae]
MSELNPLLYLILYNTNLMNHRMSFDFKELKKKLKEVEVLFKENLDIQTRYLNIQLWIEVRLEKIIQELEKKDNENDEESDEDDEDLKSEESTKTLSLLTTNSRSS